MKREITAFKELMEGYMIRPKGMFIWRDIPEPGFEGRYHISNHGEVCSIWNREISQNDTQVTLINIDKSRHNVSRKKLLRSYWHVSEHFKGEEGWKKLDHHGDYYVSNYANVKNCRRIILLPTNGRVKLYYSEKKGKTFNILALYLKAFTPEEIFIDHEKKEVNYIKKNDKSIAPESRKAS